MPGWLRFGLRWRYVLMAAAVAAYVSSGIQVLVQNGGQAFGNYLLSWALLKPVAIAWDLVEFASCFGLRLCNAIGGWIEHHLDVAISALIEPAEGIGRIRERQSM